MGSLIVELLDRFGKVKERHHASDFPCKIGRGYDNDIIIDDPYISPTHITVNTLSNAFTVNDNDSKNGLFSLHPFKKQQALNIEDDTRIRIGHTDIRFRFANHPVKEAIQERNKPSKISMLLTSGFILPIVWIIFGLLIMFNNYIEDTGQVTFQSLLSEVFPILIVLALWAMGWSIISKIVTHRFYFSFHAIWASVLTLLSTLVDNLANYFEFSFSLSGSASVIIFILGVIVTSILFYGHLRYSTTFSDQKSRVSAITASIILLGLVELLSFLNTPEFTNKPDYSGIIKPASFIFAQQQTMEQFFKNTQQLKLKIDNKLLAEKK
ncbi:hypothetical protein MNBD_GAMMA23-1259 [hydrothermal vent metagenome]|uniref:FHA domain-containing protein n=1 Tax=hydrothermal vent metagenome TaxID=652676 RepID=A0A3B1AAN6_9ZZZZ